jgi:RHS repeat-associated protein
VYPDSDDPGPGDDGSDDVYDRVEVSYNRQSEIIKVVDQNGTEHSFEYDGLRRQIHDRVTSLGTGIDGAVRRLSRGYSRSGRLDSISSWDDAEVGQGSAVNEVAFRYNGFGQLTRDYQSHAGAVAMASTPMVQYAYADGTNRHIRKLSTTYPNGREIAFSYGTSGSADDKLGRVHEIQDASDEDQVLARYTRRGISATMRIEYPEAGSSNPLEMTYIKQSGEPDGPAGDQYTGQDQFNRIIDIRWLQSGTSTHVDRIQYGFDRAGNRLWRQNVVAGTDWDELYGYDGLYQLPNRKRGTLDSGHTGLTNTVQEEGFSYDPAGNWTHASVAEESDGFELIGTVTGLSSGAFSFGHLIGMPPVAVSDTIKVDGTPFTVTGVIINSPTDPATEDGFYDITVAESTSGLSNGGPITAEGEIILPQDRVHNEANEITYVWPPGSPNPGYDGAGNMTLVPPILGTQPAQWDLTWDAWNRLVKIEEGTSTIGEYQYDGFTRRVWKESDEGSGVTRRHFYYSDQWQVLEERTGGSELANRQFVWGLRYIDDLVLRDRGSERRYVTHDQWHVIATVATDGNATERFAYRAFGQTQVLAPNFTPRPSSISAWETTYGAYRYDAESGLYALRFRYLHPGLGRWLSRDPIGEAAGLNLQEYVANRPPNFADPLGLAGGPEFDVSISGQSDDPSVNRFNVHIFTSIKDPCCEKISFIQLIKQEDPFPFPVGGFDSGEWRIDFKVFGGKEYYPCYPHQYPSQLNGGEMVKSMDDLPGDYNWPPRPWGLWNFETCIVCLEGKNKGTIYGCYSWEISFNLKNNKQNCPPSDKQGKQPPQPPSPRAKR